MTATELCIPSEWRPVLNAGPGDFTLRLALADWFAERGEHLAEEAIRWSVEKGRVPSGPNKFGWCYFNAVYHTSSDPESRLPHSLYEGGFDRQGSAYSKGPSNDTRSPSVMFDMLLKGWASGTDEQRQEWWRWNP
jgi:uncharacterized protein (TIGR02996 family)